MRPVQQDLEVYQGDNRDFFFRVRKQVYESFSGEFQAGDYEDLSNWTAKAQVRSAAGNGNNNLLAEFQALITNQLVTKGGVLLRLTPLQTSSLPATATTLAAALTGAPTLVWDCQLTTPTNEVKTFIAGLVRVLPEVTRT